MKTVDVPSLGSVTVIKFHDQQQLGEGNDSFHFLTARSQSIRQELKQEPQCRN